ASDFAQSSERKYHLRNTALHVENAGPVKAAFLLAPRHSLKCPNIVHGIEMTEQQHWLATFAAGEMHLQMVSGRALPMNSDTTSELLELACQVGAQCVAG